MCFSHDVLYIHVLLNYVTVSVTANCVLNCIAHCCFLLFFVYFCFFVLTEWLNV